MNKQNKKKPLVHPNVIGKREMQRFINTIKECVDNPMPKDERERLNKLWKLGPYREWKFDENAIKRIKEIDDEIHSKYVESYSARTLGFKGSGGNGKKQLEAEYQKLILEIENG